MAKLLTPETTIFESVVCNRCSGSGSFSFNLMHGSKCYGCRGHGVKLTKRGAAAATRFKELCSKPAKDLKLGDVVLFDMFFFGCWSPISEIEECGNGNIVIRGVRSKTGETVGIYLDPNKLVEVRQTADSRAELVAQAKAFEASLTKTGKPRKERS